MTTSMSAGGRSLRQNSIYIGINLENIFYGGELLLYLKTMVVLLKSRRTDKKSKLFYAFFSSMMVFSSTVWIATSAAFGEKMWLLESDFTGGPDAYLDKNISIWYLDWGTTAAILLQLMTDGLMINRCRRLWGSYRAVVVPVFFWLSTLVLGILVDWASSSPGGDFFSGKSCQLALAYYTVSVSLNTILTSMICYRLLRHGKKVKEDLGREYASFHFSIVTLIVESVLPCTLSGILFLVLLGIRSPTSAVFLGVYVMMMCITPQVLILSVLEGRAWGNDMSMGSCSTIQFNNPSDTLRTSDSVGVDLQRLPKVYLPEGCDEAVTSRV